MSDIKMSDLFELPVRLDETWCGIYSGKKQVFKPNFNFDIFNDEALAAVEAINSYDANQERIKELEGLLRILYPAVRTFYKNGMGLDGDCSYWAKYNKLLEKVNEQE